MMNRIGLMDCNNFFVSCERLFRPDLLHVPVAVLSSNDGCVVARSQEVKDIGIAMGAPYFQIKDICKKHKVEIFSSNFALYRDISSRVMSALKVECGACEVYSIDEAFFKVPDDFLMFDIESVRSSVMRQVGIPVSIGVGSTKTIAKSASVYAKKELSGAYEFDQVTWAMKTSEITCGSIWGIGRQTTALLTTLGIKTVKDFLDKDRSYIRQILGVVGERLYAELSGEVVPITHAQAGSIQESITSTRSFAKATKDIEVLRSAVGYHMSHVAEKLRSKHVCASRLTIMCAPGRYSDFSHRKSTVTVDLLQPTNNTSALLGYVEGAVAALYDPCVMYKKAGVTVSNIVPESFVQASLFEAHTHTREASVLDGVIDSLNDKFGSNTIHSAMVMRTEKWMENKLYKSPEYTTKWTDLQLIKAK